MALPPYKWTAPLCVTAALLASCSSSEDSLGTDNSETVDTELRQGSEALAEGGTDPSNSGGSDSVASAEQLAADAGLGVGTDSLTSETAAPPGDDSPYVVFEDPNSDFRTADVYDANRQVFHFDGEQPAMVAKQGGFRESDWVTNDLQLGFSGGVYGSYQIRFGTEEGQRRAYFTEVTPPTICDLVLVESESLNIYRGTETVPTE